MGILNIFKKKKKDKSHELNLGDGIFANEKGKIYGELKIKTSLNDKESIHTLTVNTTIEKLKEDDEQRKSKFL